MAWTLINDGEGEQFAEACGIGVRIPLSYERVGEDCRISYYPSYGREAEVLRDLVKDDPSGTRALEYLDTLRAKAAGDYTYRVERETLFRYAGGNMPVPDFVIPLAKARHLPCLVECDVEATVKCRVPAYCAVVDGNIVSLATAEDPAGGRVEIGMETAPAYRRRGYAAAVLSALAEKLIKKYTVAARAENGNLASHAALRRAGFVPEGEQILLIGERRENGV